MKTTCYIVDDEAHAIALLRNYIERTPGWSLIGSNTNPLQALEELNRLSAPDLIFLDVDMPELNGLQFAGLVKNRSTVVFTTAYREYALEAFESEAADYLLKPIQYERFLRCLQKFRRLLPPAATGTATEVSSFFVKTGIKGKHQRVSIADIRYLEAADNYLIIHLADEKLITHLTMREVSRFLSQAAFSRIHKSFIINDNYIRAIEPGQVRLSSQQCLPIGPAFRQAFLLKFQPSFAFYKDQVDPQNGAES